MAPGILQSLPVSASSSTVNVSYPSNSITPEIRDVELPLNEGLEPIAIIGMGCRLPGDVESPSAFWDLIMNKNTGQTPKVPISRFNIDAHFHQNNERPGSFNVLGGYFLKDDLGQFDPVPFSISPVEAMWMDPQQRKLLEVVYEAFENGGVKLDELAGSNTACFVGSFTSDFQQMSFKEPDFRHSYAATGVDPGIISNRISHVFNLSGPSITVNTACSSSVYALHNACNALRNKECQGAVVGGTNLVLTVDQHMNTAKLGVLSPTSTCHTFDESADGYGRADAVGAVYVKRLSDALRARDPIRAVIRSSAVNSNGRAPAVGITYPGFKGQVDVITAAYRRANLDPNLTGYFECHGTGTPIGDPLEVHAVSQSMTTTRESREPLLIGAVKTNIGHSEAASGLSAVIKAVLAVETGIIPPTRGLVNPNPKIKWDEWRVKVVTEPTPFPSYLPIRRVSVNSFGYGGTNGHVIIDNVESVVPDYRHHKSAISEKAELSDNDGENADRPHLLVWSAYDKNSLNGNIKKYRAIASNFDLLDLANTLAEHRSSHSVRAFAVCSKKSVSTGFSDIPQTIAEHKKPATVAFAFTGQGAQWPRMGAELIMYYPTFARSIKVLDQTLASLTDGPAWTLAASLLELPSNSHVNDAEYSQPLCTAVQIALVELLARWNVFPVATVGHSSGEIAAAFASGYISAQDAIIAAYYRGKAVASLNTGGAMLAVGLGAEEIAPYLEAYKGKIVIACHNSPKSSTLSGDADAIDEMNQILDTAKVFARPVKSGNQAYHSHHMTQSALLYKEHMKNQDPAATQNSLLAPRAMMVSSVTGYSMGKRVIDGEYWSSNLVSPVMFNQAFQKMMQEIPSINLVVEIGPHSALSGPIRQICAEYRIDRLSYAPSLLRHSNDAVQMLKLAGDLWVKNSSIDLRYVTSVEEVLLDGSIGETAGCLLVDLPTYQWNYSKNLWAEPRQSQEHRAPTHGRHDVLGVKLPGGSYAEPIWRNILRQRDVSWLKHHSLGGEAVFPAAGYFSMAIEAITQLNEDSPNPVHIHGYSLRDISIKAALVTPDDDAGIETLFSMRPSALGINSAQDSVSGKWFDFNVSSYTSEGGNWKDHMTGTVGVNIRSRGEASSIPFERGANILAVGQIPATPPHLQVINSGKSWNKQFRSVGFDYGATFQDMDHVRSDGKTYAATSKTVLKQECGIIQGESRYVIHPGTVDSCLQLVIVSIYAGRLNDMTCGAVPIQVDEVTMWVPTNDQVTDSRATAFAWTSQRGNRSFISSTQLVATDGELLLDIADLRSVAYEAAVIEPLQSDVESQTYMKMEWKADIDHLISPRELSLFSQPTIGDLVDLLAHKNAATRILDIDGKSAAKLLSLLKGIDYSVTISSKRALNLAQKKLKDFETIKFLDFDISDKMENLASLKSCYDLVIASEVLESQVGLFGNISHLLAPGGRLLVTETRRGESSWSEALKSAGFLGTDLVFPNIQDGSSMILSTVSTPQDPNELHLNDSRSFLLVYRERPASLVSVIAALCTKNGWSIRLNALKDVKHQHGEQVIMLAEMEGPLLKSVRDEELKGIQSLAMSASSILWITCGGLLSGQQPEFAMASGLARSLRSENVTLNLVTLDTNPNTTSDDKLAEIVLKIASEQATGETEYIVDRGLVLISRLVPSDSCNEMIVSQDKTSLVPFEADVALVGTMRSGDIVFQDDQRKQRQIKSDHVEIKVMAAGLNQETSLVIHKSDYPNTFSHEIAGVITGVGSDVSHFNVGDRVVGFCFDYFATYQRTSATLVHKIADSHSFQAVATLPMAFAVAIYGLNELAHVEPNEAVLILDGTGTAGLAAMQICRLANARIFVVTKSETDRNLLRTLDLSSEQIITGEDESVIKQVKRLNGGRGVDIVFSCGSVNANISRECWRSIAPYGRYIEFGRKNALQRRVLDILPLNKGASVFFFDLLEMYDLKPHVLTRLLNHTMKLYNDGSICAIQPITIKKMSELDDAIYYFSDRFAAGKVVVSYEAGSSHIKVLPTVNPFRLQPDATYLLVGCLGGLGRSLTTWMIERGAKHFAFLSRSGTENPKAADLIASIEARQVTATVVRGDVTVKEDVEMAIEKLDKRYPIRGVVQAAMVLNDGIFQNMSLESWRTATGPKVQGTLNLHEALLSHELDFFVMTSSTSGTLGTPGQSNYAAGNAFLESLSRHRKWLGLPAVSLVLPMVVGVGYVAEHPEIEEALRRKGIYGIDEDELLNAFEISMKMQSHARRAIDHVVVGLEPSRLAKSVGRSETTDAFWTEETRFRTAITAMKKHLSNSHGTASDDSITAIIETAGSTEAAIAAVTKCLVNRLSKLLRISLEEFEPDVRSIASYGLDSMIGAELRNWIFREFQVEVPFQQLLGPTLTITKFAIDMCAKHGKSLS